MNAAVLVDPIEYLRHPDEPADQGSGVFPAYVGLTRYGRMML